MSKGNRKRKPARGRDTGAAPTARREPPATPTRASTRAPAGQRALPDELLPPWERGPVRAFVRDAVDARGPRPMLLFMPAFAVALITDFGPQSELGHILLLVSLAALAVVAVDALLLGTSLLRAARAGVSRGTGGWLRDRLVRVHACAPTAIDAPPTPGIAGPRRFGPATSR